MTPKDIDGSCNELFWQIIWPRKIEEQSPGARDGFQEMFLSSRRVYSELETRESFYINQILRFL